MWGLGDNIYTRPFVRAACRRHDVYLETPWPEIFADLPVRFVRGERRLRTQMRNVDRQPPCRWSVAPVGIREVRLGYGHNELATGSIVRAIERHLPLGGEPLVMDLPDMGPSPVRSRRPLALVRPVTVRQEWRNEARNPRPDYVNAIAARLMATHHVVSVADLAPGQEWPAGALPAAHRAYHGGELAVEALLALVAAADVVVGGVGWIVPAAIALKVRAFIILGGHGGHNAPEKITDPRLDLSRLGFAVPKRFCRCSSMLHPCDKWIPDLSRQWSAWTIRVGLGARTSPPRSPFAA